MVPTACWAVVSTAGVAAVAVAVAAFFFGLAPGFGPRLQPSVPVYDLKVCESPESYNRYLRVP